MYELRRGAYFFDKKKFKEEVANKYIGYQVAHMSVSFIVILIVYLIITLIASPFILSATGALDDDGALFDGLVNFVIQLLVPTSIDNLGVLVPLCGSLGFQLLCNRVIFFTEDKATSNTWLRYPFWYGLFDYNLLYTNALIGITICIGRLAVLFVFFVLFLARLDKTTMPGPRGGFLNTDPAFKAYIGMLRLDHRYNNPLFLVFGDILLEQLNISRVRTVVRQARRVYLHHQFERKKAEILARNGGIECPEVKRLQRQHKAKLWAHRIIDWSRDEHKRRCILIRNKWQLAWRCIQQPRLHQWREDARLKLKLAEAEKQKLAELSKRKLADKQKHDASVEPSDTGEGCAAPPASAEQHGAQSTAEPTLVTELASVAAPAADLALGPVSADAPASAETPKPQISSSSEMSEMTALRAENERLKAELAQAQLAGQGSVKSQAAPQYDEVEDVHPQADGQDRVVAWSM